MKDENSQAQSVGISNSPAQNDRILQSQRAAVDLRRQKIEEIYAGRTNFSTPQTTPIRRSQGGKLHFATASNGFRGKCSKHPNYASISAKLECNFERFEKTRAFSKSDSADFCCAKAASKCVESRRG